MSVERPDLTALILQAIQRIEEVRGDTKAIREGQERLDAAAVRMDSQLDQHADRMDGLDRRIDGHETRIGAIEELHKQEAGRRQFSHNDRLVLIAAGIGGSGGLVTLVLAHFFGW